MVRGPAAVGSVARTDPTTKRSAGESVRMSTTTSPRTPCGRTIRPTTSCIGPSVRVDDVDPHAPAADRRDHLTQGLRRAAAPADHGAQVVGVHPDLEPLTS